MNAGTPHSRWEGKETEKGLREEKQQGVVTSEESEEWNKVWPIVKRAGVKSTRAIYHSPKLVFATASFVIFLIAWSCISL